MRTLHRFLKLPFIISLLVVLLSCGGAEERKAKYLERGKKYFAEKNYDKAMVEFKNVLQIDPKSADGYFLIGQVEEQKNDFGKAFGYYSKSFELDPNNLDVREKLAGFYLMGGQPDKAEEMVSYLLQKKPNDPKVKLLRGGVLVQKGNTAEALKLALEVSKTNPAMPEAAQFLSALYKKTGDLASASTVLEQSLTHNPKNIQLYEDLALIYMQQKKGDKAEQLLKRIVEIEPDNLQHRVDLGSYYAMTKQFGKTEAVIRDAIKADPSDANRRLLLANFLSSQNRGADAEAEILSAIKQFPKDDKLRFALAGYYGAIGKADQAEKIYHDLIENDRVGPSGMDARKKLAELLRQQKKPDEASKLIAEVLKENAQDPEALLIRGKLELGQDKPDLQAAITDFRSILKNQPDSVEVLELLAVAHQLNHEPDLARTSLQNAARAASANGEATVKLARFMVTNDKDINGAERVLDQFLTTTPNDLSVLEAKLDILSMKKDGKGILETIKRIKNAAPDKPIGYYRAGEYYLSQGRLQEALQEFEQARDRSKADFQSVGAIATVYAKMNKPGESIKALDDYLATNPKSLDALSMKANVMASLKDEAGLGKVIDQIKQLFPGQANGYYMAGQQALNQKNYDKALQEFKTAAEKAPTDARISASILKTYLAANKPDEALAWLDQVAKSRPDDGFVHYLRAEALVSQKKYSDAEVQLQKTLQLMPAADAANMPKRSEVYLRLADINMMQNHTDAAIKTLQQGLAAIPGDASISLRLASAYQSSGQYDEAIAAYEQLLKANPRNVLVANNLASLLADYKKDPASLDRAKKLAAPFESTSEPALLDTLGWIYYRTNDLDKALPLLKKAVDGAPKAGILHYHLGMAYYKKGDKAAAKRELTQAFASNQRFPGDDEGRAALNALQ